MERRLTLRRSRLIGADGQPRADDYDVVTDGYTIGRIMKVARAGNEQAWFWSFLLFPNLPGDRGDAATFEQAKAAIKARIEATTFDPATLRRT